MALVVRLLKYRGFTFSQESEPLSSESSTYDSWYKPSTGVVKLFYNSEWITFSE